MSPITQTLELPMLAIPDDVDVEGEPEYDALAEAFGIESSQDQGFGAAPSTMSIPLVGTTETLVLNDSATVERSLESLTISPLRAKLALAALAVGAFAVGANEAAIVALSPQIASGLGVPVATIGLLVTAFALTIVVVTLPLTFATKRLSRRVTMSATLGVWTTGVVVAATAGSVAQLAGGRVISGAAHALFWAIVAPTATRLFAPHLRARTVTRIMVGAAASGVIGTPLVTIAGKSIGWQAPFWALAVIGLLLTVAMSLTLPGSTRVATAVDGDEDDDSSPAPITRGDLPSKSAFIRVLAVAFLASTAVSGTWTYIVPFYTGEARVTSDSVPLMFALGGVLAVGATLAVSPFLASRAVRTVAVGILVLMLGWVLLAIAQPWSAIAAQVAISAGWAILLASMLNWAMRHTPWRIETGAGTYTMTMNAGAAAGPILGAGIVGLWGIAWLPVVSLGITFGAAVVTLGADKQMRRRLHVPRRLRMAMQEREALRARRREWGKRSSAKVERPKWKASTMKVVSKDVAKRAGAGAARAVKRKPRTAAPGKNGPPTSRSTRQRNDSDAEW